MTERRYAFFHRTHVRAWLVAAALGGVWLNAHAVSKGNIGRAGITQTGRTTSITPGSPPTNSGGSTIPISPSMGGWTQAGNYGMPTGATGPTIGHVGFNGQFVVGGSGAIKYPVSGSYSIPWSTVAAGAAGVICVVGTAGACAIGTGVAAASPYIMNWLERAGLSRNAQTGDVEQPDPLKCTSAPCYFWGWGDVFNYPTYHAACAAKPAQFKASNPSFNFVFISAVLSTGTQAVCTIQRTTLSGQDPTFLEDNVFRSTQRDPDPAAPGIPKTLAELIQELTKVAPDPRVWGETIERGAEVPIPNPTVTGPTQIQGPERTTTNPDGSRTVTRTTHNFQPSGNTVTNTSNVTTTTTYNIDNSVRSTSTTTETPVDEQPPEGECEKRPNSIGCQELDPPEDGEIPKETKTITFAEEPVFGGGSCPSDKQWSSGVLGGSYKVVDWQTFCDHALPARFLVLLLATFAAFLIVMPGKEVRT